MLRRDQGAPLTMARAAEVVDASPMSLYRYFADRDDLAMAVTNYVLREARISAPADAPWQDRVRAWMTTVYDQAVRYPQLFHLAASGESLAWLSESAHLATILETAGFRDDRALAEAVFWVGTATLGQAMVAAAMGEEMTTPRLYTALGHLTTAEAGQVARLVPHFAAMALTSFTHAADLTITALETRLTALHSPA